jgi:hypothetical protein
MRRRPLRASILLGAVLAVGGCTEKSVRPENGVIDVTPKANGHYVVDGESLSFAELEQRIAEQPPAGMLLETSRIRHGAACIMMLGFKTGTPIWTRSLNGATHQLKSDLKPSEVETIEKCR